MSWLSCIISNVILASFLAWAAYLVQRCFRSPTVARLLWVLVLVKLVTPPLVSIPLTQSPGMMACVLGTCACGTHVQEQGILAASLPWILLAGWSTGAGAMGWTAWRRWRRFQRLIATATPASSEWQLLAGRLATDISLYRAPKILIVPGRLPPLVIPGWRGARLLVPQGLIDRLDPAQIAALLMHELFHLKHRDHLVRLLELTVGVIFWWLPIVGAIGRQLRACEEACCDMAVVAHLPQARRDYACLLLDVLDFADPLAPPALPQATAMSVAQNVEERLRAILCVQRNTQRARLASTFALLVALALIPCEVRYGLVRRPLAIASGVETAEGRAVVFGACEPNYVRPQQPAGMKPIAGQLPFSMLCPDAPLAKPTETDRQINTFCCPS